MSNAWEDPIGRMVNEAVMQGMTDGRGIFRAAEELRHCDYLADLPYDERQALISIATQVALNASDDIVVREALER